MNSNALNMTGAVGQSLESMASLLGAVGYIMGLFMVLKALHDLYQMVNNDSEKGVSDFVISLFMGFVFFNINSMLNMMMDSNLYAGGKMQSVVAQSDGTNGSNRTASGQNVKESLPMPDRNENIIKDVSGVFKSNDEF